MIFTASQFDGEMTLCGKKSVMVEYWKDNGQRRGNKIKKIFSFPWQQLRVLLLQRQQRSDSDTNTSCNSR